MDKKYYQKKILKYIKKMDGGTCRTCPKTGFHQHKGECWNDALSTILIYSDGISENIQEIFDSSFNFDDCVRYAKIHSPKYLLPINIEDEDYDKYVKYCKKYFNNIYKRYINEYKDIYTLRRRRRNSENLSLNCIENSFEIYNINNSKSILYNEGMGGHGGEYIYYLTIISNFNYFMMNYKNKSSNIYIIDHHKFNLPEICITNKLSDLNFMKYLLSLEQLSGIVINLSPINVFRTGSNLHAMSFFSCGNKQYFYDDNGITDEPVYKNFVTFIEFNWREYLTTKINFIIDEITKNINDNNLDLYYLFSDFLFGHSTDNTIGRSYLEDYNIDSLLFIYKNRIDETMKYDIHIKDIISYSIYTNNRTFELFFYFIDRNPDNIYILEYIFNQNKDLFKKILEKLFINSSKFNFDIIYEN
jgi:hypothetical protein